MSRRIATAATVALVGVAAVVAQTYSRNAQGVVVERPTYTFAATSNVETEAAPVASTTRSGMARLRVPDPRPGQHLGTPHPAGPLPDRADASREGSQSAKGLYSASKAVPQGPIYDTNFVNVCPDYRGGPCSDTPHTKLQCTDPLVSEMIVAESVWEVWCMQGNVQVCVTGRWPAPEGRTACEGAQ